MIGTNAVCSPLTVLNQTFLEPIRKIPSVGVLTSVFICVHLWFQLRLQRLQLSFPIGSKAETLTIRSIA